MYYVLGDGGAKYGPADVSVLKQWVAEARLTPTTMLEDAVTGAVVAAADVPDLFPASPATSTGPTTTAGPYTVPGPATSGPVVSPYGTPVETPSTQPNYNNPYPRMDMGTSAEAEKYATATWILGATGFLCCCLGIASIVTAVKARQLGHPKGDILLYYAIGMTVAVIVLGTVLQIMAGNLAEAIAR